MLLASVALFGSCEDFLSKEDPNKIDAPSYFRNETDLQTYINGFLQTMSPTAASVATATPVPTAWHGAANTSSSRTTLMPTTSRAGERAIGRICATSTIFSTTSDRRPSARQRSLTTRASPFLACLFLLEQGQDFRGSALVRFDDRFQRPRGALQASRQSRIRDAQGTRRHRIRQHVLHIEFGSGSQLRADHPIRRIGTQSPYLPL